MANISKAISELSDETKINAFLVGGCVRDLMLNPLEEAIDVDIMVEGNGIDFAKKLAKKINVPKIVPFEKFATAKIPYREFEIEVASARLEKYEESSRNPSEVVISKIDDDLLRRDFTVNAMAVSLNKDNFGEFFDPFNGMEDLSNKILRTPLDSDTTFSDDPLRMKQHCSNAEKVVDFLTKHKNVERVIYPTLHKGAVGDRTKKYFSGGNGALIGIEVKGGVEAGKKFIEALKMFYHVANIGDARSLAIHPATTTHSQLTEEELLAAGVTPGYVRLSIGIEHPDDIIADLKQALDASGKPSLKAVS